jgi:tripartite-type tricarboxylate transporter receptor subunit TctC
MIRILAALFLLSSISLVSAREVDVISRYSVSSTVGQIALSVVDAMNTTQDRYKFRYKHLPGAGGETAVVTALEYARRNRDVIWLGPVSVFTTPFPNRKWTIDDFTFVSGMSSSTVSLLVSKGSGIDSVEDLVNRIRTRGKGYYGSTVSSNSIVRLNQLFMDKYDLADKIDHLKYRNISEISLAILNGELDYVIYNQVDLPSMKPLAGISSKLLSAIAVPGDQPELLKTLVSMQYKLCNDMSLQKYIKDRNYSPELCTTQEQIKEFIAEELKNK